MRDMLSATRRPVGTPDVLHQGAERIVVRTLPVDPAAVRAHLEIVVVPPCPGRQAVFHLLLHHGFEKALALEASAERCAGPEQVQPTQDLDDLATAVGLL